MNTGFDTFPRRSPSETGLGPYSSFSHDRYGLFNNDFSGYGEVSGPPNYPPPLTGLGRSPFSSMPNPSIPPPAPLSQSYPSSGPGLFSGGMGTSYPMSNREQTPSPGGFDTWGMSSTDIPPLATPASPNSYDILRSPLSDSQLPAPLFDDGGFSRGHTLGTGGGFVPPPLTSPGQPYPSHYRPKRSRRASSVGPGMGQFGLGGYVPDMYHRPGGRVVKFRLLGERRSGITLNEALGGERLSQSRPYMLRDIATDMYRKITIKVRVRCLPFAVPLVVVCT